MKKNLLTIITLFFLGCSVNAQSWSPVGGGTNSSVHALTTYNGDLYAGGSFWTAGSISASGIAKWDNTSWNSLSTGVTNGNADVTTMVVYNGELYIGGDFYYAGGIVSNNIAKWNGTSWSAVGSGVTGGNVSWNTAVHALVVYNGELYVAGNFTTAGGISANHIAKWNGSSWSALSSGMSDRVQSLAVYNGELFAGGDFQYASGNLVDHITKWNGTSWMGVGGGMNHCCPYVSALAVYNGELFAGGNFSTAGGITANHIAKWNGSAWSVVGGGLGSTGTQYVSSLAEYHGELYAGGLFYAANANLAKWNGTSWEVLTNAPNDRVNAFATYDSEFYMGGGFDHIGSNSIYKVAKLSCSAYYSLNADTVPHNWIALNQATGTTPITYSWNWGDGSALSTGANPSHTYSVPGYYNIYLSITDVNGCSETYCDSSTYLNRQSSGATMVTINVVLPTGINQPAPGNSTFNIYPNPANNTFQINFDSKIRNGYISIYNTDGEKVFEQIISTEPSQVIRLVNISSGMYFVKVFDGQSGYCKKLIVM